MMRPILKIRTEAQKTLSHIWQMGRMTHTQLDLYAVIC